jgi:hypothetical protein
MAKLPSLSEANGVTAGNGSLARQPALQVVAAPPTATDPRPRVWTPPPWARARGNARSDPLHDMSGMLLLTPSLRAGCVTGMPSISSRLVLW